MQTKNSRIQHRTRQRQKLSRKMILIIAASGIGCVAIVLTIFLNTGKVEKSMAAVSIYVVPEEKSLVDMTLEAPVIRQLPVLGPNTVMIRTLKADPHAAHNLHD